LPKAGIIIEFMLHVCFIFSDLLGITCAEMGGKK